MSTRTHSWQANRSMKCPPTHVDVPPADAKQVQRSMLNVCLGLALSYYVRTRNRRNGNLLSIANVVAWNFWMGIE